MDDSFLDVQYKNPHLLSDIKLVMFRSDARRVGYDEGYTAGTSLGFSEGFDLARTETSALYTDLGTILANLHSLPAEARQTTGWKKVAKLAEAIREFPMDNVEVEREPLLDKIRAKYKERGCGTIKTAQIMRNVFDDCEDQSRLFTRTSSPPVCAVSPLIATNDEATLCRFSAAKAGLIQDPFVSYFLTPSHHIETHLKDPLINRGTFLRTASIDHALQTVLGRGEPVQVISLGAGFDTRFFIHGMDENMKKYVEIDFEEVVNRKKHVIEHHKLPTPIFIGADLEVNFVEITLPKIIAALDASLMTVVIAECCMMYLQDSVAREIMWALSTAFTKSQIIIFDPIYIGDRFGQTMARNLHERGLPTDAFQRYPSIESYKRRVEECGWGQIEAMTMSELTRDNETASLLREKAPLDEYEEWNIITEHYFILTARNYA